MRLKTLLLGSATALAVTGGAQAADLSVAEPVDYVRVCDAFGTGYWYIPGTDSCLKIWGFVDFKVSYSSRADDYDEDHYDFYTGAYFNMDVKNMTDWGPLEAFLAVYMDQGGVYFDEGFISLGPLLAGYTHSGFNQQYPWVLADSSSSGWFQPEEKTNLVRLTWAVNGFGILLELDEPNYGYDPDFGGPQFAYFINESSMPDIIAALTASTAAFDGKVSFVWSDYSGGWAVSAGVVIKLDSMSAGSKLLLKAAYGDDAPYYVLGHSKNIFGPTLIAPFSTGGAWSAMANLLYYFAPNLNVSILANYGAWWSPFGGNHDAWQAAFNIGYSPVPNLWITPEVRWQSNISNLPPNIGNGYWSFTVRARRVFY